MVFILLPFPPCPEDGPVPEEGVEPLFFVQSKSSDVACFHEQRSFSKSQDGSKRNKRITCQCNKWS